MTDTARDLIQRLADELDTWLMAHHYGGVPPENHSAVDLLAEARAYLDQPEPERLTDEELLAILSQTVASFPPIHPEAEALSVDEYDWELEARKARAVIAADRARCGRPTTQENKQMTHPLTDEIIDTFASPEYDHFEGTGEINLGYDYDDLRAAADWQLEQVLEYILIEDMVYYDDPVLLARYIKEAMRPTTE